MARSLPFERSSTWVDSILSRKYKTRVEVSAIDKTHQLTVFHYKQESFKFFYLNVPGRLNKSTSQTIESIGSWIILFPPPFQHERNQLKIKAKLFQVFNGLVKVFFSFGINLCRKNSKVWSQVCFFQFTLCDFFSFLSLSLIEWIETKTGWLLTFSPRLHSKLSDCCCVRTIDIIHVT